MSPLSVFGCVRPPGILSPSKAKSRQGGRDRPAKTIRAGAGGHSTRPRHSEPPRMHMRSGPILRTCKLLHARNYWVIGPMINAGRDVWILRLGRTARPRACGTSEPPAACPMPVRSTARAPITMLSPRDDRNVPGAEKTRNPPIGLEGGCCFVLVHPIWFCQKDAINRSVTLACPWRSATGESESGPWQPVVVEFGARAPG